MPAQNEDLDDDWVLEDDDDPEFQAILCGNPPPAINNGLPQRTLEGRVATGQTPQRDQYEEIPVPKKVNLPTHHVMDFENLKTYIYPTNFEIRDYQFNIVRRAFYDNVLVALPTGLGKTFIASTVMLNFLRWFPNSKIIFMAPTRPLVAQQIKACCSITGIPSSKVAILLDKTRKNRAEIWDSRQVFFTTPQVVENDLVAGTVDPKSISLLVIDEAHRAKGNFAYNNVVKFLDRFTFSYRILALTATPSSDVEGVQEIINNLNISKVEVRTELSIDTVKYMKKKIIERKTIPPSPEIEECIDMLATAIEPVLKTANERGLLDLTDPTKINFFQCNELSRKMTANPSIPEGLKWSNYFILQLLGIVGQCYRRLNIYGIRYFYEYFHEKFTEFKTKWNAKKSTNKLNADFYFSDTITTLLEKVPKMIEDCEYSHPKIEALMNELSDFFEHHQTADSKVIIFTEFRGSALEIVQSIEKAGDNRKPHIFIGQAKEKEKFDVENFGKKKPKQKGGKKPKNDERPSGRTSSEAAQISGMNQKVQKEVIKKFKNGEYNILVATSIGEEGLDIGEVDLIICYDSTSSPIKNVQRMGRTGRKRDGKVLLLFSSNEESKFDKAMGGYEYIQQRIMKGDLFQLRPQNRIIPESFSPEVVKTFIEIPEENIEIKAEDDEDQIIKIATLYMLGQKGKKGRKTTAKKSATKKFFMPDDVETGFRSVASMVRKVGDDKSLEERKREKTFLDTLVDSDSDSSDDNFGLPKKVKEKNQQTCIDLTNEDIDDGNIEAATTSLGDKVLSVLEKEGEGTNDEDKELVVKKPPKRKTVMDITVHSESDGDDSDVGFVKPKSSLLMDNLNIKAVKRKNDPVIRDDDDESDFKFSSDDEKDVQMVERQSDPVVSKSLGVKKRKPMVQMPVVEELPNAVSRHEPTIDRPSLSKTTLAAPVNQVPETRKSLGIKRSRPLSIIDQLKKQKLKSWSPTINALSSETEYSTTARSNGATSSSTGSSKSDPIAKASVNGTSNTPKQNNSFTNSICLDTDDESEDDKIFDDGLDDVLGHISSSTEPKADTSVIFEPNHDDENEGFLNNLQLGDLYTNYYMILDPSEQVQFYDPVEGFSTNEESNVVEAKAGGKISHSVKTERLLKVFNSKVDHRLKKLPQLEQDIDLSFIVQK